MVKADHSLSNSAQFFKPFSVFKEEEEGGADYEVFSKDISWPIVLG